ncbi:MAG: DUF4340 domain-containing protein [Cyanobacteria bacterium P01_A01_bin.84]
MKLPRTTIILLLLALGLGVFVYFYEIQGAPQRQEAQEKEKQIFSFTEKDVQALSIKTANSTIKLERQSPTSDDKKWLIKSPISSPAKYAYVSYLMNLLVAGKSEESLSTTSKQLNDYGLEKPSVTIDIQLKNKKNHKLVLGGSNFDKSSIYARKNPSSQSDSKVNILLVSPDFINAVNRDISEWKQEDTSTNNTPLATPSATPLNTPSSLQKLPTPNVSPVPTISPTLNVPPTPTISPTPVTYSHLSFLRNATRTSRCKLLSDSSLTT